MSKTIDDHLKRLNPTGIEWADMTEQQKEDLRDKWNAVASDPENLNCTCPRTFCRNNHNCRNCIALHRYFDGLPDCLRRLEREMQADVPPGKRYTEKMNPTGMDGAALAKRDPAHAKRVAEEWNDIVKNPKNTACNCPRTDCWYHGNCVKCIALHRSYDGFPNCVRYIVDEIEAVVDAYKQTEQA